MPSGTEPPGELMYREMSDSGSSAASSSICAAMRLEISESTCCPSTMIRCWSSRSYTESDSVIDEDWAPRRITSPTASAVRGPAHVRAPLALRAESSGLTSPLPSAGSARVSIDCDPTRTNLLFAAYGQVVRCGRGAPQEEAVAFSSAAAGASAPASVDSADSLVDRKSTRLNSSHVKISYAV